MALKCGIIGLTNSGKTTIFNCISNSKAEITSFAFSTAKSNIGIANVRDLRLQELDKVQKSQKLIPTTVELVDIPGLAKGASKGEGIGNQFLSDIRNVDALIHVLRCFEDDSLPHIEGSINPVRDIELVDFELQIKDLELIDRKIDRQQKLLKTGDKDAKKNLEILARYKDHLENFQSIRTLDVDEEERKVVKELQLLTEKPVMLVCNVDDKSAANGNKFSEAVLDFVKDDNTKVLLVAGALEAEISELDEDDQKVFLEDVGLVEPSVDKLTRAAYALLNLETFFTVGPKEIHAWTIRSGSIAPRAAGVIHSDLERGFIRAEVMKYKDYVSLGSEQAVKDAGKFHVEGKNYVVEDGDILNIRFNV